MNTTIKKMMFASAIAAGVFAANADVTSANTVGYLKNNLRKGVQLMTGTFVDVASGEKQMLTKIEVGGYENHESFQSKGTDGQFYFYFLNEAGGTPDEQYFSWYHQRKSGQWKDAGKGWYDWEGNHVGEDVDDIELTPGDAIYLVAPTPDSEAEIFTFGDAGQVLAQDQSYPLIKGVNLVGNMMPIVLPLSSITISGYENHESFQSKGTDGQFYFYFLNEAGGTPDEQYFSWYHQRKSGQWKDAGKGWYDWEGNLVGEDVDDVNITPGLGMYVVAPAPDNEEVFTIDFEAPKLNN